MREREESKPSTFVDAAEFLHWDEVLFGLMNQHPSYRPKVHWSGRVSVERSNSEHAFSELFNLADKLIEFITSTGQTVLASDDASGRVVAWAGQVCGPKRTDQESSRCEINVFALIRAALRSSFVPLIHGNNWRPALQDDFDEMIQQLEWIPDYWCGAVHSSLTEFEPWETTPPPDYMRLKRKINPARSAMRKPPFYWGKDHWIHDAVKRFLYALPEGEFKRDNRFDRNFKQTIGCAWFGLVNACASGKDDTFLLIQRKELVAQLREWFGASSVCKSAEESTTIISMGKGCYRIADSRPCRVTDSEDAVLTAFLESPAMDEQELDHKSGFSRSRDILRDLESKYDGKFAPAIHRPGGKGKGGYHVSIRVEAKPSA